MIKEVVALLEIGVPWNEVMEMPSVMRTALLVASGERGGLGRFDWASGQWIERPK
ncbi:hypothetical protein ACQW08_04665 [Gluconobacter japonicus]|uniref:hypothetical protein n=1 Tax=Gluconobacter japonicus TaxID=376620 RepID=UPI003D294898